MTPREFRDEAVAFAKSIHPKARLGVIITEGGFDHDKPLYAHISDVPGLSVTDCCCYAETFDEIVPALSEQWAKVSTSVREKAIARAKEELAAAERETWR